MSDGAPRAEVVVLRRGAVVGRHELHVGQRLVFGRDASADVALDEPAASRRHVLVELDGAGFRVTDLGSRNGTLLAGVRLGAYEPRAVSQEGELRIGEHALQVRLLGAAAPAGPRLQDEYEALRELGRGANGAVVAARHRASGRSFAVKTLDARGVTPTQRARFLREAALGVSSPHVVSVHEVRDEGERVHLVMELMEGGSLAERLARGPLLLAAALEVAEGTAVALVAAHAQGIVHRDVKPANILFAGDGAVKLGDFGIARVAGSALTASAHGMGTLAYVAPEQVQSARHAGPAADLYGLGATLYHMLAGRPPFDPDRPDALERVLREPPEPLTACPPGVAGLVQRLLEKEPADRLPNATLLLAKLRELRRSASSVGSDLEGFGHVDRASDLR